MRNTRANAGYSLLEVMLVAGLIGVISAIAIPMTANSVRSFRIGGDARSISAMVALAKMRAASAFSRTRVFIDLSAKSYRLETQKSTAGSPWVAEGGTTYISVGVTPGFGSLSDAPPDTQDPIAQAPACQGAFGSPIPNTACVTFNSRGIPIDSTGTPTGAFAVYVTDGMVVDGVTISATGLTHVWRSPSSSVQWVKQ